MAPNSSQEEKEKNGKEAEVDQALVYMDAVIGRDNFDHGRRYWIRAEYMYHACLALSLGRVDDATQLFRHAWGTQHRSFVFQARPEVLRLLIIWRRERRHLQWVARGLSLRPRPGAGALPELLRGYL
jgi:hypothetical protein